MKNFSIMGLSVRNCLKIQERWNCGLLNCGLLNCSGLVAAVFP